MGGRGQGIHTPHLTYTSSLPLSVSYGPSGFEQMSSVPRAQGSWQTLERSQALTCFKQLVGRGSSTFLERGHGGAAPRDTMLTLQRVVPSTVTQDSPNPGLHARLTSSMAPRGHPHTHIS